eukprot:RCo033263
MLHRSSRFSALQKTPKIAETTESCAIGGNNAGADKKRVPLLTRTAEAWKTQKKCNGQRGGRCSLGPSGLHSLAEEEKLQPGHHGEMAKQGKLGSADATAAAGRWWLTVCRSTLRHSHSSLCSTSFLTSNSFPRGMGRGISALGTDGNRSRWRRGRSCLKATRREWVSWTTCTLQCHLPSLRVILQLIQPFISFHINRLLSISFLK